jgi:hypothetical protein
VFTRVPSVSTVIYRPPSSTRIPPVKCCIPLIQLSLGKHDFKNERSHTVRRLQNSPLTHDTRQISVRDATNPQLGTYHPGPRVSSTTDHLTCNWIHLATSSKNDMASRKEILELREASAPSDPSLRTWVALIRLWVLRKRYVGALKSIRLVTDG